MLDQNSLRGGSKFSHIGSGRPVVGSASTINFKTPPLSQEWLEISEANLLRRRMTSFYTNIYAHIYFQLNAHVGGRHLEFLFIKARSLHGIL